MNSGFPK